MDIPYDGCKMLMRIDQYGLITTAKERTVPLVSAVEPLGINAVHMAHHAGEISFRCPEADMIMVAHKAVSEDLNSPKAMSFL